MTPARTLVAAALAVLAGCGGRTKDVQQAKLGPLAFELPADWQAAESHRRGIATAEWAPDAGANDRKEAVTVIRTELAPAVAKAGAPAIERLLRASQAALAPAKYSKVSAVATAHGLAGLRIDLDYVPPGMRQSYHRIHVVLVDGAALVHVLYTAADPDAGALDTVLASIRHEEG